MDSNRKLLHLSEYTALNWVYSTGENIGKNYVYSANTFSFVVKYKCILILLKR